jgi:arylsulfatase A-like enzyme
VLLVSIESLRADHVGCYGYRRPTTPSIDRLAAEGTRYAAAYSVTSWTLAAHASLFTGLYPSAHRVIEPRHRLAESYVTLAETLGGAGYQCAAFVSGPFLRRPFRLDQGFEIYDEEASSPTQEEAHADVTNPEMEEKLLRFLRERRDPSRPFFLFAYFWDPHFDFLPPPPYDTLFAPDGARPFDLTGFLENPRIREGMSAEDLAYVVSQYDGEIRCTDDLLGRLFETLRAGGLWENTIVVVTADHGEEFFEHGAKGHKNNLFAETVRVPLVVKWADGRPAAVDSGLSGLVDLHATLAAAAGLEPPPTNGRDLSAAPRSASDPLFQELVTTIYGRAPSGRPTKESEQWWGVRMGSYRLVSVRERNSSFLYDVGSDPAERLPLGIDRADLFERYSALFAPWHARMRTLAAGHPSAGEAVLAPEEIERLRSLGYVRQ